jgi:hypothetical protein
MTKWLERERRPEVFVDDDKSTPLAETRHRKCAFPAAIAPRDCAIFGLQPNEILPSQRMCEARQTASKLIGD